MNNSADDEQATETAEKILQTIDRALAKVPIELHRRVLQRVVGELAVWTAAAAMEPRARTEG